MEISDWIAKELNGVIIKIGSPDIIYMASVHLPDSLFQKELIDTLIKQKNAKQLFNAGKNLDDSRYDERIASALVKEGNMDYWKRAITNWPDNRSLEILINKFVSDDVGSYLAFFAKDMKKDNMTIYAKDILTRAVLKSGKASTVFEALKSWPDELYSDLLKKAFAYLGSDAQFMVAGRDLREGRIDDDIIERLSRIYEIVERVKDDWPSSLIERLEEKVKINEEESVKPKILEPANIEINGKTIDIGLFNSKERSSLKISLEDYSLNIDIYADRGIECVYLMVPEKGWWHKKDILGSYASSGKIFTNPDSFMLWDKTKENLEQRLGINFGDEPRSIRDLAGNVSQLLTLLRNSGKRQIEKTTITSSNLKEFLSNAIMVNALRWIPESFNDNNFDILKSAYSYPWLYSSPDMFSPPSERVDHALRFELTIGCDYNACTFCDGYKDVKFKERNFEEFKEHYEAVKKAIGSHKRNIRRVFIGGGNALGADHENLRNILRLVNHDFRPRRISIYGRADSIIEKGINRLKELKENRLNLIYLGIESGADDVLNYVNKNINQRMLIDAGRFCQAADIDLSVMIMPGLGGIRFYNQHVNETYRLLNIMRPRFITFMGVNVSDESAYSRIMADDKDNRPLTKIELMEQTKAIIERLPPIDAKIGMFNPSIDSVGCNPLYFNTTLDHRRKNYLVNELEEIIRANKVVTL